MEHFLFQIICKSHKIPFFSPDAPDALKILKKSGFLCLGLHYNIQDCDVKIEKEKQ